jgi:uncharacterized protein
MAKFEIKKSSNGTFYFHFIATGHSNVTIRSQLYRSKSGCETGIHSVKKNAPDEDQYTRLIATDETYYFNLKATNGEIIGTSPMFGSVAERENHITLLKIQALAAPVIDLT